MNVDTDQFAAIKARADGMDLLAADVAEINRLLRGMHFDRTAAFAEGAAYEAEQALRRGPRHARPRGERSAPPPASAMRKVVMSDFETTAHALRRWAAQMDASDRAAVELLAWHEFWLRRAGFKAAAVVNRGVHLAVDWAAAREFADAGPRASTSEMAILDLAVAIGEDRFRFGIMGAAHSKAIAQAVARALGEDRQ
jgi:hypothetical protein